MKIDEFVQKKMLILNIPYEMFTYLLKFISTR